MHVRRRQQLMLSIRGEAESTPPTHHECITHTTASTCTCAPSASIAVSELRPIGMVTSDDRPSLFLQLSPHRRRLRSHQSFRVEPSPAAANSEQIKEPNVAIGTFKLWTLDFGPPRGPIALVSSKSGPHVSCAVVIKFTVITC